MRERRRWLVVSLGVIALLALVIPGLGLHRTHAGNGDAPSEPDALESAWSACLRGAVHDGEVDYGTLAERGCVQRVARGFARIGPSSSPAAFEERDRRLAYHVNAYNVLTLLGVLEHRVERSVHEVSVPWSFEPGLGFFWAQYFLLDGTWTNLYGLENDVLRPVYGDPRVHAAINCASRSCPPLRDEAYHAAAIDAELEQAAAIFASRPPHVRIEDGRIELSSIYQWYASDFGRDEAAVLDWIQAHAQPDVRLALSDARAESASIVYVEYDWALAGHW